MIVEFGASAESDLERIGDYIAKDSPVRALSFVRELRETCLRLADAPQAFPLVARYGKFGIRRRVHGNFLIFYRVEPARIVVLHILHGAMDFERVLFPNG